ncbi:hypothetical protein L6R52_15490 [Myxococcota bacterium]|nr:hypothetical protein [Myxococcota bacterium]
MRGVSGRRRFTAGQLGVVMSFVLGAAQGLAGCADEGCKGPKDCAAGLSCVSGVCEREQGGGTRFRDAGPDSGIHADAAAPDTGAPDTGVIDAGDGGVADAGPDGGAPPLNDAGLDAGPRDAGEYPSSGELVYAELFTGAASEATGSGTFEDRTGTTYTTSSQSFADGEGSSCTVTTARLASGSPTPITAQRIVLTDELRTTTRTLVPDSAGSGTFDLSGNPGPGLFTTPGSIFIRVDSAGTPGSLEDTEVSAGSPRIFFGATQPAVGVPVNLLSGVAMSWTVAGAGSSAVVEVADAPREVVMKCTITDDGSYTIPIDALRAWYAEGPTAPATLELRYDDVRGYSFGREGGAPSLPVNVRLSRGVRWSAF